MSSNDFSKIQRDHTDRLAYVYIRQSSLHQVQHNTASTARQYNLVERAKELGWPAEKIIVVDQDQGLSGASVQGRDGFKIMMKDILLGNVGAVFSLEASRLARDSSDWHLLVKLCVTRNTLIIDDLGIHNPRVFNDHLLLSIKGTLSDAELHLIASRLNGGRLQRAREGKLRVPLPAGYVYNASGCTVIDPSLEVQQTIRLFFDKFEEVGSCLATVRYFRNHNLLLPNPRYQRGSYPEVILTQLNQAWAQLILHNPTYAGIYVYGRSRTEVEIISTETMETGSRRLRVPREEWGVVIRDHHEAYITEERYRRNLQRLKDNRSRPESPGAVNRGPALLQGLARCGVCGRSMQLTYPGKPRRPVYNCVGQRATTGKSCQSIASTKVEDAVTELVLKAFEPAQLDLAKANLSHLQTEGAAIRDQWNLQLQEAQTQAETAGRLFKQAAIQNRHVASELQDEWERALDGVEKIKRAERNLPLPPSPDAVAATLTKLASAARNLDLIWGAPSTSDQDRKQLIRLLIKDVILIRKRDFIVMTVRWVSGGRLMIEIPWASSNSSDPEVIELITQMAPTHPDRAIAEKLNALGFGRRRAHSKWTAQAVYYLRRYRNIPQCPDVRPCDCDGPRGDGRYSTRDVARMVGCDRHCIAYLCKQGKLDAIRSSPKTPWWIKIDSVRFEQVREAMQERKNMASHRAPVKPRGSR